MAKAKRERRSSIRTMSGGDDVLEALERLERLERSERREAEQPPGDEPAPRADGDGEKA